MKFNILPFNFLLLLLLLSQNVSQVKTVCTVNQNGCSECSTSDTSKCSTCAANYYLSSGACISCPSATPNSYEDSIDSSECFACSAGANDCITCSETVSQGCTKCAADTYLSNGICESCPSATAFAPEGSTSSNSCHACTDSSRHCKSCSENKDICTKCALGYYLDDASCIACPRSCPNCVKGSVCKSESNHLGAILGGVLSLIAVVVGILVIVYKKDVVPKLKESLANKVAKYHAVRSN